MIIEHGTVYIGNTFATSHSIRCADGRIVRIAPDGSVGADRNEPVIDARLDTAYQVRMTIAGGQVVYDRDADTGV